MKKSISVLKWLLALPLLMGLVACDNDDDYTMPLNYPTALVTLKTDTVSGKFFLQLNDTQKLWPVNIVKPPYEGKEVRALVNFNEVKAPVGNDSAYVQVNWVDTIRTKPVAENKGEENVKAYGNDPVEIVNDWTTVLEDGYLTLRFRTYYGGGKPHRVNLVRTGEGLEYTLYHDAEGDVAGRVRDALVAFKLSELPKTDGKKGELVLKWQSFSGEKHVTFTYQK